MHTHTLCSISLDCTYMYMYNVHCGWMHLYSIRYTLYVYLFVGDITVRTHTSKRVVNKLSRFHTTAGMESFSHSHSHSQNVHNSALAHAQSSASSSSSPTTIDPREFPSSQTSPGAGAVNSVSSSTSWNNPRTLPLPCPVSVSALQQVKQPYLTNGKLFVVM